MLHNYAYTESHGSLAQPDGPTRIVDCKVDCWTVCARIVDCRDPAPDRRLSDIPSIKLILFRISKFDYALVIGVWLRVGIG